MTTAVSQRHGVRKGYTDWTAKAERLRNSPRRWFKVAQKTNRNQANFLASSLRWGHRGRKPMGDGFEVKIKDDLSVWARYVGERA